MPAAMHLTVLVSLFAVNICTVTITSSTIKSITETTTSAAHHINLAVTGVSVFTVNTNNDIHPKTTHQISTTEKASSSLPPTTSPQTHHGTEETHPSTPLKTTTINQRSNETTNQITMRKSTQTSNQTPNQITDQTSTQKSNQTTNLITIQMSTQTSNQTPNQMTNQTTVSYGSTLLPVSESPNVTATTNVNTTSPGLSHEWVKDDLTENPGLVAILCIFCIVLVLVLVVATVKCIQTPRSNFERLEDMPMGNVNEESPFAQFPK